MVGEPKAGKTSLVSQLCHGIFNASYTPTRSLEFFIKRLSLPTASGNAVNANIQLYDVAGGSRKSKLVDKALMGAAGVLLVYDTTSEPSFARLADWMTVVKRVFPRVLPALCLIGTKGACPLRFLLSF